MDIALENSNSLEDTLRLLDEREADRDNSDQCHSEQTEKYKNEMKDLVKLQEERDQVKETIAKNLKGLVAQKHALQKVIQDTDNFTSMPITHKFHEDAIEVVCAALNFLRDNENIRACVESENDVNTQKLCRDLDTCNEIVFRELNASKDLVNQVKILDERVDQIKNYCISSSVVSEDEIEKRSPDEIEGNISL